MDNNPKQLKYKFLDFFNLDEIQKIQDLFSDATGVASIITEPDGTPITKASGFSAFCTKVRCTKDGLHNCMMSDKLIGSPKKDGPRLQRCISGGLYDGGASIMAGSKHIANWLIGQVLDEDCKEEDLLDYTVKIGLDDPDIKKDINNITRMSVSQFEKVCNFLYYNARLLSNLALENLKQKNEIAKRLKTEKLLEMEKEQFKVTISSIGDGVIMTDENGTITFMNRAMEELTEWTNSEASGKKLDDVLKLADEYTKEKRRSPASIVLETGRKYELEDNTVLICKSGKEKYITDSAAPIMTEESSILGVVIIIKDATRERMQQKEIINRDLHLTAMINNISDVIGILDEKGMVKFQSENIEANFGWKAQDCVGRSGYDIIHPDDLEYVKGEFQSAVNGKTSGDLKTIRLLCKDGSAKYVKMSWTNMVDNPNIGGILVNYHDISERIMLEREKEEAQAMLRNQQKLESIGTLASGVAHEINNPINGIMNYSQLIMESETSGEQDKEFAQEIYHETLRVSKIVKNLLQFSRQDKEHYSQAMVEDIIEKTLSLIKTIIRHDQIALELNIEPNMPPVECRNQQIQQVLMNLITNARDSLNDKYEGYDENKKISISAFKRDCKNNGPCVRIVVKDFGGGIPDDIRQRVFEPFFTTKDRTKGTGLGLAISYNIMQEHNGRLSFETKKGEYAEFIVDLRQRQPRGEE